ncbi:uncharacterized protein V1518DRAFT_417638 [Limtongia smithiae]|uniref:uncharacterized protein n=1 Tax=Limtongia smithiae TaxID=1125753 RepID=UPI0034CD1EC1
MPDPEKVGLYLYSVPPSYDEAEDDAAASSSSSSTASSARNAPPSIAAERQHFLPRGLVRHQPQRIGARGRPPTSHATPVGDEHGDDDDDDDDDVDAVGTDFSTPRSSTDSEALRREIIQFEIIEPPPQTVTLRPSLPSRIVTAFQKRVYGITPKFTLFKRLSPHFTFLSAFMYTVSARYHAIVDGITGSFNRRLEAMGNPVLIKRLVIVFMLAVGLWSMIESGIIPFGDGAAGARPSWGDRHYEFEALRAFFFKFVSAQEIKTTLTEMTKLPHVAGTNGDLAMAQYVQQKLKDFRGLDSVTMNEYEVFLTFANESQQRLALLENTTGAKREDNWQVVYEANLTETEAVEGKGSLEPFPFHALSANGNATGHIIYANYGTKLDFETLKNLQIEINGAIVFCRYGAVHESLKIMAAELHGAAGVVVFRDKDRDGQLSFPEGRAIPEHAVERGSAALRNWAPGDPLSEGWSSTPWTQKGMRENSTSLVHIPSMPVSWDVAKHFIAAMKGHGHKVGNSWKGHFSDVDEWWTGNATTSHAHLKNNLVEKERQPIWNVVAKIEGSEQSEKAVIIGAHRDAWCYGASDAISGTAAMLEVSRTLAFIIYEYSWRPLRSIYFISWDGSEENLMGSTEWVEEHIDDLRRNGLAYINLDRAITGSQFRATGSPLLERVMLDIMRNMDDPFRNASIRELWGNVGLQPSYNPNDGTPFQSYAGIASIDIGFDDPYEGYPTRTCFDNMDWIKEYGDPQSINVRDGMDVKVNYGTDDPKLMADDGQPYVYHRLLTQLVGGMAIKLADDMNVPFDFSAYARAIVQYMNDVEKYSEITTGKKLSSSKILQAVSTLIKSAITLENWVGQWMDQMMDLAHIETNAMSAHRMSWNSRMVNFDKHLLNMEGLPGRPWFKHVLLSPEMWPQPVMLPEERIKYDYHMSQMRSAGSFAAVRDALERGDFDGAQTQLDAIAELLLEASQKLVS